VTQEFQISVTPVGAGEYLVRTERVEPGVPLAEEQVRWSVETWLEQASRLMHDPLLNILQGKADDPLGDRFSRPAQDLLSLGQILYDALFSGSLRDSWMMAQGIAQHRRVPLRLRLGLKDVTLNGLPWEVLHDRDRPLAASTDILFSRYQPSTTGLSLPVIAPPPENGSTLRILMAIAAPTDQENLALRQEAANLKAELQRQGNQAIEVDILEQPDRSSLTQALEQGHYHIFHYAGHSNPGEKGGKIYLVSRKTGLTETLSGDDLAGLIANNNTQMVVFNSCRGAYSAQAGDRSGGQRSGDQYQGGERNLANALIKRGIPAVLAMADRIPDDVALMLTQLFYRNLNQGFSIDLSLSRARQGLISSFSSSQLYWALPIFYLHPEFDGGLLSHTREDTDWLSPAGLYSLTPPGTMPGVWDEIELDDLSDTNFDPAGLATEHTPPTSQSPTSQSPTSQSPTGRSKTHHPITQAVTPDLPPLPPDDRRFANPAQNIDQNVAQDGTANAGVLPDGRSVGFSEASATTRRTPPDLARNAALNVEGDAEAEALLREIFADLNLADGTRSDDALGASLDGSFSNVEDTADLRSRPSASRPSLNETSNPTSGAILGAASETQNLNPSLQPTSDPHALPVLPHGVVEIQTATSGRLTAKVQRPSSGSLSQRPGNPIAPSGSTQHLMKALRGLPPKAIGIVFGAIVLGGFGVYGVGRWVQTHSQANSPVFDPRSTPTGQATDGQDFSQQSPQALSAIAMTAFSRGDWQAGLQPIEELLDRNALVEAEAALNSVKPEQLEQAPILFLKGRWAWQAVAANQPLVSVDDARRYWQTAANLTPERWHYQTALGFAYYAEGDLPSAHNAWKRALTIAEQQQAAQASNQANQDSEALSETEQHVWLSQTYAGLALCLQYWRDRPPQTQQAMEFKRIALTRDPVKFQTAALAQNWLWTSEAIAQWEGLTSASIEPAP